MSLDRLAYDAQAGTVTYTSDKSDGPTAGPHTFEAAAFIARLVDHIPDKGQVLQRYYGHNANRTRGVRPMAQAAAADAVRVADVAEVAEVADVMRTDAELPLGGVPIEFESPGGVTIESKDVSLADARRRWADLLRRIYEVDPLQCPKCGGAMRVIALIQEPKVIDKILRHLLPGQGEVG